MLDVAICAVWPHLTTPTLWSSYPWWVRGDEGDGWGKMEKMGEADGEMGEGRWRRGRWRWWLSGDGRDGRGEMEKMGKGDEGDRRGEMEEGEKKEIGEERWRRGRWRRWVSVKLSEERGMIIRTMIVGGWSSIGNLTLLKCSNIKARLGATWDLLLPLAEK